MIKEVVDIAKNRIDLNVKHALENEINGGVSFFFNIPNKEKELELSRQYQEALEKSGLLNFAVGKILMINAGPSKGICGRVTEFKGGRFKLISNSGEKEYGLDGLFSFQNTFDRDTKLVKFVYSIADSSEESKIEEDYKSFGEVVFDLEKMTTKVKEKLEELNKKRNEELVNETSYFDFFKVDEDYYLLSKISLLLENKSVLDLISSLELNGKTFGQIKKIILKEETDLEIQKEKSMDLLGKNLKDLKDDQSIMDVLDDNYFRAKEMNSLSLLMLEFEVIWLKSQKTTTNFQGIY